MSKANKIKTKQQKIHKKTSHHVNTEQNHTSNNEIKLHN